MEYEYKTYWRKNVHSGAVEEVPFDASHVHAATDSEYMARNKPHRIAETAALRLINGWNRQHQAKNLVYWLQR